MIFQSFKTFLFDNCRLHNFVAVYTIFLIGSLEKMFTLFDVFCRRCEYKMKSKQRFYFRRTSKSTLKLLLFTLKLTDRIEILESVIFQSRRSELNQSSNLLLNF